MVQDKIEERQRLSFDITPNICSTEHQKSKFPPDKYPINCTFFVLSKDTETVDDMKKALSIIPKDNFKFQKKKHRTMDLVTVNIYLKNADSVRPLANMVKDKELFIDKMLGEKKVLPRDLVSMAQNIIEGKERVR